MYKSISRRFHKIVLLNILFHERIQFKNAPVGAFYIRRYIYGETEKHHPSLYYAFVRKSSTGFEHTYLSREQGENIIRKFSIDGQISPENPLKELIVNICRSILQGVSFICNFLFLMHERY
jgi:hypothetical protein